MTIAQDVKNGAGSGFGKVAPGALQRWATPLTIGLFLVSTVSGVALFFHWAPGAFHSMHEWLSVALLAPVLVHVWRNWRPFVGYVRRGALYVPLGLSLLLAAPFAISGLSAGGGMGNPAFRAAALLTHARLADLAPVLKMTPDDLTQALDRQGAAPRSVDETLDAIAARSNKNPSELLIALLPKR